MAADQGLERRGRQAGGRPRRGRRGPDGAAQVRGAAARAAARSTRSGRRASPSTRTRGSTTASAAARAATRSRSSARRRASTSPARSSGSPTASTSRSSTRRSRPAEDAQRRRRERLFDAARAGGVVLRALPLGVAGRLARARLPGRAAASARRSAASSGSGSRSAATRSRARRPRRASRADELRAAGLTRQRGGDYFQRRLVFPLADARGRVVGFQARRLHEDDPLRAKYVNTPESRALPQGLAALRPRQGAGRDLEGRPRAASSRGTPT